MKRSISVLLLGALLLGFGFGDLERGNRYYREGKYAEAVEAYRRALADGKATPELHYNLGTALLRLKEYDEAERHLRAALASVDPDPRQRTHFNLGSRYLEAARGTEDPRARAQLLDAAVEAYKHALRLDPADVDAKWNLELALRERDEQPPQHGGGGANDPQDQRDQQDQQEKPDQGRDGGDGAEGPQQATPTPNHGNRPVQETGGMTREQAERILSAVEQDERELYRRMLRRGQREIPVARDW